MSASIGLGMVCLAGCPGWEPSPRLGFLQRLGSSCQAGSGMGEGKDLVSFSNGGWIKWSVPC